jgi:hypothetical protein
MKSTFNKLEKIIIILSILSISFLLIIQFLNYDDNYTIYTSRFNNKNRFIPFSNTEVPEKGIVILKNITSIYNEIEILLNGDSVGNFINNDEIKIYVYDNDIIEIDGTKYSENLNIKVVGISNNIETPKLDTILTTSQSIEILGKVQLK